MIFKKEEGGTLQLEMANRENKVDWEIENREEEIPGKKRLDRGVENARVQPKKGLLYFFSNRIIIVNI